MYINKRSIDIAENERIRTRGSYYAHMRMKNSLCKRATFYLLVAIVHTRGSKKIVICAKYLVCVENFSCVCAYIRS